MCCQAIMASFKTNVATAIDRGLFGIIQSAPERMDGFHRKSIVLKLHQIKLLLIPSNSQANAVYLWNTTSPIWCPWVWIQELRYLLKFLIILTVIAGVICWISSQITLLPQHLHAYEWCFSSMLIWWHVLNPPTSKSCSD